MPVSMPIAHPAPPPPKLGKLSRMRAAPARDAALPVAFPNGRDTKPAVPGAGNRFLSPWPAPSTSQAEPGHDLFPKEPEETSLVVAHLAHMHLVETSLEVS